MKRGRGVNGDAGEKTTHGEHGTLQKAKRKRLHGGRLCGTKHRPYLLKAGTERFCVEEAGAASSQNASEM